ncbi:MAG: hypothetical protein ACK58L_04980, partial [Planctomycetota bacterium]
PQCNVQRAKGESLRDATDAGELRWRDCTWSVSRSAAGDRALGKKTEWFTCFRIGGPGSRCGNLEIFVMKTSSFTLCQQHRGKTAGQVKRAIRAWETSSVLDKADGCGTMRFLPAKCPL